MMVRRSLLLLLLSLSVTAHAQTWTKIGTNLPMDIRCAYFWDTATGVVGGYSYVSQTPGLYYYRSGTWSVATTPDDGFSVASFRKLEQNRIFAIGGRVFATNDSGATWYAPFYDSVVIFDDTIAGARGFDLYKDTNDIFHFLNQNQDSNCIRSVTFARVNRDTCVITPDDDGGVMMYSWDGGITWDTAQVPARYGPGWEVYGDECASTFYTIDESERLFRSTDGGKSWGYLQQLYEDVLVGHEGVMYTGGSSNYRSIDSGKTWQSIGGPGAKGEDYRIFSWGPRGRFLVVPARGGTNRQNNVWLWDGGQPQSIGKSISFTPNSLFIGDTIICDTISKPVVIRILACYPPHISSLRITGRDSAFFKASFVTSDSIVVTMIPNAQGQLRALLLIYLNDGSIDTVSLNGFGKRPTTVFSIAPRSLFGSDTLLCDSISRLLKVTRLGCDPARVLRVKIVGQDSSLYRASLQGDSIRVILLATTTGERHASLLVEKSDGTQDTITLGGYVILNTLRFTQHELFLGDTSRCDSLYRTISESQTGCHPPVVTSIAIIGGDANRFHFGSFASGSIPFTFFSDTDGDFVAKVIITLSDGKRDTILLQAASRPGQNRLAFAAAGHGIAECDTIECNIQEIGYGCQPPIVASVSLSGNDADRFKVRSFSNGEMRVAFFSVTAGDFVTSAIITSSDGHRDTIMLQASARPFPSTLSFSPSSLFLRDTIQCDPTSHALHVTSSGCAALTVVGAHIEGDDAASYSLGSLRSDSIIVTLLPSEAGAKRGQLILNRSDGRFDTIMLYGTVLLKPKGTTVRPSVLFLNDTARCAAITRYVTIHGAGCTQAQVGGITIAGDSAAYAFGALRSDSLPVTLLPARSGRHSATLVIAMSDGTVDSVVLAGTAVHEANVLLASTTSLFANDTSRCDTILRSFTITRKGCSPPSLTNISIVGNNSGSYELISRSDTISLRLLPVGMGPTPALLVLEASDGTFDTISLLGTSQNSGGHTSLSASSLFTNDTLRCDTVVRGIHISRTGCEAPSWSLSSIIGDDAQSYVFRKVNDDSIEVSFVPQRVGSQQATALLSFSDGSSDSVRLGGFNASGPSALLLSPDTLFALDSLYCGDSVVRGIHVTRFGCSPLSILSMSVAGVAVQSYQILSVRGDSILLSFTPETPGKKSAFAVVALSNTTFDTIALQGFCYQQMPLRLTTSNVSTDTIGGLVALPIMLAGLQSAAHVQMVVHYGADLEYVGSVDANGRVLDIEQWSGRALLDIPDASSGAPIAWAQFHAYGDSTGLPRISFDSVWIVDANISCRYILPDSAIANIQTPNGCGFGLISSLTQYRRIPPFRIVPNPAGDVVSVKGRGLTEGGFEVYDMLGRRVAVPMTTQPLLLEKEGEITLDVHDVPEGVYYLRINGADAAGHASARFVIQR
jgi:hypothetical protein